MIWAEKIVPVDEGAVVQDAFESLFMQLGGPQDMMLVSTEAKRPHSERLICSLPDEDFLALFDGFEVMPEAALPKKANLLLAQPAAFEERFGFPR